MEVQTKKKFNRKLLIPVFAVLCMGLMYAGAVIYHNITVSATVSEALSSVDLTADFSGYPGETIVKTFTVDNAADVPLSTDVSWTETDNTDGVSYTTDMPKTLTLAPGVNTITVEFVYAEDTVLGDVSGLITLSRVA